MKELTIDDIRVEHFSGRDAYKIIDTNGFPNHFLNKEKVIGEISSPEFVQFKIDFKRKNPSNNASDEHIKKLCVLEKLKNNLLLKDE